MRYVVYKYRVRTVIRSHLEKTPVSIGRTEYFLTIKSMGAFDIVPIFYAYSQASTSFSAESARLPTTASPFVTSAPLAALRISCSVEEGSLPLFHPYLHLRIEKNQSHRDRSCPILISQYRCRKDEKGF